MVESKCKFCGKSFEKNRPNKVYCSKECKGKGDGLSQKKGLKGIHKMFGICIVCGKQFKKNTSFQKYCSQLCHAKNNKFAGKKNRKRVLEYAKRYSKNNRTKRNAERLAQRNKEKLIKSACEVCGRTESLSMHHKDYSKPLEVITLCGSCHTKIHRAFPAIKKGELNDKKV